MSKFKKYHRVNYDDGFVRGTGVVTSEEEFGEYLVKVEEKDRKAAYFTDPSGEPNTCRYFSEEDLAPYPQKPRSEPTPIFSSGDRVKLRDEHRYYAEEQAGGVLDVYTVAWVDDSGEPNADKTLVYLKEGLSCYAFRLTWADEDAKEPSVSFADVSERPQEAEGVYHVSVPVPNGMKIATVTYTFA